MMESQKQTGRGTRSYLALVTTLAIALTHDVASAAGSGDGIGSLTISNVAISVMNIDRSSKWYAQVLGFRLATRTTFPTVHAEVAFMTGPGIALEFVQVPGAHRLLELDAAPPAHLLPTGYKAIVFDVENLAVASKELEELGVTIVWNQQVIDPSTGLKSTLIRDPDGNLINLFQRKSRGAQ
jgi:catechol 2,3-dioxygenase-like lactoylglutathione lyase family enzyme